MIRKCSFPARVGLAALTVAILAACGDHGVTDPAATDAARAADAFDHLADSIAAVQGEAAAFGYRDAAWRIRVARRVTPISVVIDGQSLPFFAIASAESLLASACPPPGMGGSVGMPCLDEPLAMRTLIAWQAAEPRRVLMLGGATEQGAIGSIDASLPGTFALPAMLRYTEGRDHLWTGTDGSYTSAMTVGDPCPAPPAAMPMLMGSAMAPPNVRCREAELTWQFAATVDATQNDLMFRDNAATGTHTISLAKTTVAGVQMTMALTRGMGFPGGIFVSPDLLRPGHQP